MTLTLKDKKVLVTGGSRGIGKALVRRFLEEGASVLFLGLDAARGEAAALELSSYAQAGNSIHFIQADISEAKSVERAFTEALKRFEKIDVLVNNAGITKDQLLMKLSEEDWDRVLDTNLKSIFHTCKAIVRPMLRAKAGSIINISSVVGLTGNAGQTNYAASKAGMIGFSKSLAKEVASRGITVNCVAPGFITSDMTESLPENIKNSYLQAIPLQRFGNPEEIANIVLFLASDSAKYITGQVIAVDGGMTM